MSNEYKSYWTIDERAQYDQWLRDGAPIAEQHANLLPPSFTEHKAQTHMSL